MKENSLLFDLSRAGLLAVGVRTGLTVTALPLRDALTTKDRRRFLPRLAGCAGSIGFLAHTLVSVLTPFIYLVYHHGFKSLHERTPAARDN